MKTNSSVMKAGVPDALPKNPSSHSVRLLLMASALLVVSAHAQSTLTLMDHSTNGGTTLRLEGAAGDTWWVQASADPTAGFWSQLGPVSLVGTNAAVVVDATAAGHPARFYRAVRPTCISGQLDPTFGFRPPVYEGVVSYALVAQPDGKIVVLGVTAGNSYIQDVVLLRYDSHGGLDPSFGTNGVVFYYGESLLYARDLALQPDGKLVVLGDTLTGPDLLVWRYNPDGTLDSTFGFDGTVTYHRVQVTQGDAVAVASDGKLVVAGTTRSVTNSDVLVLRLNSDGTLDPTFGDNGAVTFGGYHVIPRDVAVQPDGRILLGGRSYGDDEYNPDRSALIARFDNTGQLDSTFADGGVALYKPGVTNVDAVALAIQPDGKIVVSLTSNYEELPFFYISMVALRYDTNGILDTTFGDGGVTSYPDGHTTGMALQADGKVVVVGYGNVTNRSGTTVTGGIAVRYDSAGVRDNTFGQGGVATFPEESIGDVTTLPNGGLALTAGGSSTPGTLVLALDSTGALAADFGTARPVNGGAPCHDVTLLADGTMLAVETGGIERFDRNGGNRQYISTFSDLPGRFVALPDGGFLIVGSVASPWPNYNLVLERHLPDGTLDSTFGAAGRATYDGGKSEGGQSLALQPDGKILVLGSSGVYGATDTDLLLVRFNSNGTLDRSFGTGGAVVFASWKYGTDLALQPDGKILVAGTISAGNLSPVQGIMLARLMPDGTQDLGFGTQGFVTYDGGFYDACYAIAVQPDGRIVVTGYSLDSAPRAHVVLLRYTPAGVLDTTFGDGGVVLEGERGEGYDVLIQPDGKILLGGYVYTWDGMVALVARYDQHGTRDVGFGNGGIVTYRGYGSGDSIWKLALDTNGNIVAAGAAGAGGSTGGTLLLMRLLGSCPTP